MNPGRGTATVESRAPARAPSPLTDTVVRHRQVAVDALALRRVVVPNERVYTLPGALITTCNAISCTLHTRAHSRPRRPTNTHHPPAVPTAAPDAPANSHSVRPSCSASVVSLSPPIHPYPGAKANRACRSGAGAAVTVTAARHGAPRSAMSATAATAVRAIGARGSAPRARAWTPTRTVIAAMLVDRTW